MYLTTDKQTIEDLSIFGKPGGDSVYQLFNKTYTSGGARALEEMFRNPLNSDVQINARVAIIRYFQQGSIAFPLQGSRFEEVERYLADVDPRSRLSNQGFTMSDYKVISSGVAALTEILYTLQGFLDKLDRHSPYNSDAAPMLLLLRAKSFETIFISKPGAKLSSAEVVERDNIFRFQHRKELEQLLRHVYRLDAYISIARTADARDLVFPKALAPNVYRLSVDGLYHPLVTGAVPNSIEMTPDSNIVFLTGANMAGKSTFMKSLGIAVYLAHLGFPVPAKEMAFSVCDGVYTTINLPDNLSIGASHFYAEVLRVKKIAGMLAAGKNLFVIFDELFRGTNVKDAYEATIAVMESFAQCRHSLFVVSTHIIEAGDVLREKCANMLFRYMPTRMNGNTPVYPYTLAEGITADRHGMVIINNEGVVDLLKGPRMTRLSDPVFAADKQTVEDLNMLGKFRAQSVYGLFNKTQTRGGEQLLSELFARPMTDPDRINQRSAQLAFFQRMQLSFPVGKSQFESIENYLSGGGGASLLRVAIGIAGKKISQLLYHDAQLLQLQAGISITIEALQAVGVFFERLAHLDVGGVCRQELAIVQDIYKTPAFRSLLDHYSPQPSLLQLMKNDYILRHSLAGEMQRLLKVIYHLDVCIAVAGVGAANDLVYATALPRDANRIDITGLRHPWIRNAVGNTLRLSSDNNVLFLTGANMAGKSTLMKSFGIAVYLAHMGFPVAAEAMAFSVKDGLYSSINVSDDLNMGYSHFYAEVLRAKTVAQSLSESQDLYVIFDELFKGTNVKDAYDATLAVAEAFADNRNSCFIISTHIIEVGAALRNSRTNVRFAYLPTIMEGKTPRYPYTLKEGVTSDRHGMMIIRNEGILDILSA